MLERFFTDPAAVERLKANLLGSHLDSYTLLVSRLGYRRRTVREQLWALAKLGKWLEREGLVVADFSEGIIERYLDHAGKSVHRRRGDVLTLHRFLDHIRSKGLIPCSEPKVDASPLGMIKKRYDNYLTNERGVTAVTGSRYWYFIRCLLVDCFGDGPIRLRELCAQDISRHLLRRSHSRTPKVAQLMVVALRSFFRFLFEHRETECDLSKAVLPVPTWRLADVPKYLESHEVEHLLNGCDRSTPVGRRNHAVLLLLARLGLRAGEVVALELDDIDWRAGEVAVRGKGMFHDRLPLPHDAGKALAMYLQKDRPECSTRRVFVRMRAPHRGFHHPSTVSTIVSRTLKQVGLNPAIKGAHLLRHSLATGMLRRGSSMVEIGDVLRHRSANSTEIYAKVDTECLRSIARPWPGEGGRR